MTIENGRHLAAHIPGARLIEPPGTSHMPFADGADQQLAEIGEFLVSSTVRNLVPGSGIRFVDRGARTFTGIEGEWHLIAAETA